jgi:hypothetical protein
MSDYQRLFQARNSDSYKPWTYRDRRAMESVMFAMHQESYAAHCAQTSSKFSPSNMVQDARAVYDGFSEACRGISTFEEYLSMCMHNVMHKTENSMDLAARERERSKALASMEKLQIPPSIASPTCSRVRVGSKEICYYALSRYHPSGDYGIDPEKFVVDDI